MGQSSGISLLRTFVHWLFIAALRGGQNYFPHPTDEEDKVQREVKRLAKAMQLRNSRSEVLVSLSRLTLCDPMPGILCSPPGSSVHGILQARVLEWVAIALSKTAVGSHILLQGIFLTQGSNLHLLHWQADSLPLSHLWYPLQIYSMVVHNFKTTPLFFFS